MVPQPQDHHSSPLLPHCYGKQEPRIQHPRGKARIPKHWRQRNAMATAKEIPWRLHCDVDPAWLSTALIYWTSPDAFETWWCSVDEVLNGGDKASDVRTARKPMAMWDMGLGKSSLDFDSVIGPSSVEDGIEL
ncbi:hypothetical protein I7I51_01003, partial [Histoplasma capsulatum]